MLRLTDSAALIVAAAGVVCAVVALVRRLPWRTGLAMALDLLTAAALLRLTAGPDLQRIAAAAALVAARQVAVRGLAVHAAGVARR